MVALALVTLLAVAPGAMAEGTDSLSGELTTSARLLLSGELGVVSTEEAALHATSLDTGPGGLRLAAEDLELQYAWRSGYRVSGVNGGDDLVRTAPDAGNTTERFSDALVSFGPLEGNAELLATVPAGDVARIDGWSLDSASVTTIHDTSLVRVEESQDAFWVGEPPPELGFHYDVDEPWVRVQGLDRARVTGTFSLFINNVTLDITSDEGHDDHWTGRETHGRTASHYESRVTVLHVRNGTLELPRAGTLDAFGPRVDAVVRGAMSAAQVSGALVATDALYALDMAEFQAQGEGSLELMARSSSKTSATVQGLLAVAMDGNFQLAPTEDVQVTTVDESARQLAAWPAWMGGGGLVALVALSAVVAARRSAWVSERVADARERRVRRWMAAGDRLTAVREYRKAAHWYQRVAKKHPAHAEAWYSLGACSMEVGDHAVAADAYRRALDLVGDDPDIMAFLVQASWQAGDRGTAQETLMQIAERHPGRLERLEADHHLRGLFHQEEIVTALRRVRGDDAGTSGIYQ